MPKNTRASAQTQEAPQPLKNLNNHETPRPLKKSKVGFVQAILVEPEPSAAAAVIYDMELLREVN